MRIILLRKMIWSNDQVLRFIQLYKMNSCIWDPQHEWHKNRDEVAKAWINIRNSMDVTCTINDLKKKKDSIMASYRSYKQKIRRSIESGSDIYTPSWFAFSHMDSFLSSVYNCTSSTDTIAIELQEEQVYEDSYLEKDTVMKVEFLEDTSEHVVIQDSSDQHYSPSPPASPIIKAPRRNSSSKLKRRQHDPLGYIHSKKQIIQNQLDDDDDDECATFGILVAKKLRKLSDKRRDVMMVKINQLFVDEHEKD